jgi:hypothetical protein
MAISKLGRSVVASALCVLGAAAAVGLAPGTGNASSSVVAGVTQPVSRQLIGQVSDGPAYFEASAHVSGTYVIEYEVTGLAFFNTYVDEVELGYVGGPDGTYQTRPFALSEGGHLVHAVGPHGIGQAKVYLIKVSGR